MQTEEMKRSYISPVIKTIEYRPLQFFAVSGGGTEWHTGTDGQGDDTPVGPSQPDPNADSRYLRQSMWEYE